MGMHVWLVRAARGAQNEISGFFLPYQGALHSSGRAILRRVDYKWYDMLTALKADSLRPISDLNIHC